MLMVLPSFFICQENNFEFNGHKKTKLSFFRASNVAFFQSRAATKKPLANRALIYYNEGLINNYSFETRNLYRPNTKSVYQVSQFETPHVENLAAELFIGFLYELCRVIDNPQPLYCP